ncbi:MAG: amidohydrolase family protein [Actinomycetota bacterium]
MAAPDEPEPQLPIKLHPCSNGEFVPPPASPVVRETMRRTRALADEHARYLGMSRRGFLQGLCGSALTLTTLAACASDDSAARGDGEPGGSFEVPPEATTDPDAAAEALAGDEFIMDVQNHLLEYDPRYGTGDQQLFGAAFPQSNCDAADPRDCYSIERYLDLVFLESDTSLAVLSAVPIVAEASPLSVEVMEDTRRVLTAVCGDDRILIHGQAFPSLDRPEAAFDAMRETAAAHDLGAWKLYTHSPVEVGFFLDDRDPSAPQVGEDYIRTVAEIGPPIIAVHKGFGAGSPFASPIDIGPAAAAHDDVSFVVYHSGFEASVAEGPYDAADPQGVDRLIASAEQAGIGPGGNVYAELGSTWRTLMGDPDAAAHVLGKLLVAFGEDNVVWGTDSIWYGSPQDQIQAFRAFQISEEYQERFGYPALTDEVKAKILGLTSARLYDVEPETVPCEFSREELQTQREALPVSTGTLGPTTARALAAHIEAHGGMV